MGFILNILYLYIVSYSIYFLILGIKSLRDKGLRIQQRYGSQDGEKNLCVVVYAHNNYTSLAHLIAQLKVQTYSKQSFSTYVILDNCSDGSQKIFASDNFAQVLPIDNQGTIGKDQAISILLEKLSNDRNYSAYVFLDANRYIKEDFLASINTALDYSPVISGATILAGENLSLRQKIKLIYHKYYTNVLQKGRSLMGLAMTIDSDIFVINQNLMNKIGCVDFQNINTELKYSLLLSRIGCRCVFNPNIKTYININDFTLRIPSISARLSLFKNCLPQMWTKNLVFTEHAFSLIAPNGLLLIAAYIYLLQFSFQYSFIVDFSFMLLSFGVLVLGFTISLLHSNLTSKEIGYLFLYPFYSIGHIIRNFPICRKIRKLITGKNEGQNENEKLIVDVFVTDGKNNIPCKLELISENGLAKVGFLFKKKKFTTKTNLRMIDAISELVNKLAEYGFVLKICQCCANFAPNIDGSTNMVKGFCKYQFANAPQGGQLPTLLWNSCAGFSQNKSKDVIEKIFN